MILRTRKTEGSKTQQELAAENRAVGRAIIEAKQFAKREKERLEFNSKGYEDTLGRPLRALRVIGIIRPAFAGGSSWDTPAKCERNFFVSMKATKVPWQQDLGIQANTYDLDHSKIYQFKTIDDSKPPYDGFFGGTIVDVKSHVSDEPCTIQVGDHAHVGLSSQQVANCDRYILIYAQQINKQYTVTFLDCIK